MSTQSFKHGQHVVYPSHGVGKITDITCKKIINQELELYTIEFEREKMKLQVPVNRAEKIGLRELCNDATVNKAFDVIAEKAQTSRGIMWSRRAQEYERKINSGDILAVAEVIRDLHRNVKNPDRSYSERMIYESAFNRFVCEASLVKKQSFEKFEEEFYKMLKIEDLESEEEEVETEAEFDEDNYEEDIEEVMAA